MPIRRSFFTIVAITATLVGQSLTAQNWPSFRGEFAGGVADNQNLPTSWNIETGENVRWATALPGIGHSSPVIWGDRIFLTTAVADDPAPLVLGDDGGIDLVDDEIPYVWSLLALDKSSGEIVWQNEVYAGVPRATRHVKSSQANSSPVTDGKLVAAILGSEGLAAFDFEGNQLWHKDLGLLDPGLFGDASSQWGYASSPIIFENLLIVQVDRHKDSFVAAFDKTTGEDVWKVERDEKPIFATPTLHASTDRIQLIVLGGDYDRGLDPRSGDELWRFARDLEVKTTTPVAAGGLIILSGGYRGKPLYAIRDSAAGDVSLAEGASSNEGVAWVSEPSGPYTSSPLVYGEHIFFVRNTGILTVLELASGQRTYRERLGGNFSASPVVSDGKLFLASEEGVVTVASAQREPEVLASNEMGASCMASPAISDGTLFLRTTTHLYAISHQ